MDQQKSSSIWWIIIIIVILAATAYAVYYWQITKINNQIESALNTQIQLAAPRHKVPEDSAEVIEKDLNATALDGLDSELSDIEKELGQ